MQTSTFFTLIAALILCIGLQTTNAETTNASQLEISSGSAHATFNSATKTIELKIIGKGRTENVSVQLLDQKNNVAYNETFVVNSLGISVDIPTQTFGPGIFELQVKGVSFSFHNTYKFE